MNTTMIAFRILAVLALMAVACELHAVRLPTVRPKPQFDPVPRLDNDAPRPKGVQSTRSPRRDLEFQVSRGMAATARNEMREVRQANRDKPWIVTLLQGVLAVAVILVLVRQIVGYRTVTAKPMSPDTG